MRNNHSLPRFGPALLLVLMANPNCRSEKLAPIPFADDFSRTAIGELWWDSGGDWWIQGGVLRNAHAENKPLWLKAKLPDDAVIEFDVWSGSDRGDVKFEIYGDGKTHASGYILIQAGWKNTLSVMARLNEHGRDRLEKPDHLVVGQRYHWKVIKSGTTLEWFIDGQPYMQFHDPEILRGEGHNRFAFNNWMSDAHYDNLTIRQYP